MEHYYSEKQSSKLKVKEIQVNLRGNNLKFYTSTGVFSKNKVDKGTSLLADNMLINNGDKVLDIGCGIGILGIVVAKSFPSSSVVMSDINERAIKLSKMNIKLNQTGNIIIKQSNLYENINEKFDTIITNPPQSAGKKTCFEIIENAKEHLKKDGLLQLVARHNKGGKELGKKMNQIFGNVKEIAKKSGYRIYMSKLI